MVIDMDGYEIQNKFLSNEMGLLKVGDTEAKSFFFDINLRWGDLTHKDRKTCSYIQNRIHKLPLGVPRGIKAFQISELEAIVENFYIETRKNPDSTIVYKGGHYEKDLLAKLNIPSINLEYFGCPKAGELLINLYGWKPVATTSRTMPTVTHLSISWRIRAHWALIS